VLLAALDLGFALVLTAISLAFWTARRRAPVSCVDLARTGPWEVGTWKRTAFSYGMTVWTALMAAAALAGAFGAVMNAR
jgi:hypothetical protein